MEVMANLNLNGEFQNDMLRRPVGEFNLPVPLRISLCLAIFFNIFAYSHGIVLDYPTFILYSMPIIGIITGIVFMKAAFIISQVNPAIKIRLNYSDFYVLEFNRYIEYIQVSRGGPLHDQYWTYVYELFNKNLTTEQFIEEYYTFILQHIHHLREMRMLYDIFITELAEKHPNLLAVHKHKFFFDFAYYDQITTKLSDLVTQHDIFTLSFKDSEILSELINIVINISF